MAFGERTVRSATGGAKVRIIHDLAIGRYIGTAFGEVGYEKFFAQSADGVSARFVGNTALPFTTSAGDLASRGLNFKVGVDGKISEMASVSLQYGLSLEDGQGQVHTGQARIKVPF